MSHRAADLRCMTLSRIVRGFIDENRPMFALYVLCVLAIPIKDVLIPHLVGRLYQSIRTRGHPGLATWIAMILGAILVVQSFDVLDDYIDHDLFPAMQFYVRELMIQRQLDLSSTDYRETEVGVLLGHMHKLPSAVYNYISMWKDSIAPSLVTILVCAAYIAWIFPWMGLLLVVILLVCALVTVRTYRNCARISRARDAQHSKINAGVDDILSNIRTITSFDTGADELRILSGTHAEYARLAKSMMKCSLVSKALVVPTVAAYVCLLVYACWKTKVPDHQFVTLLIISFVVFSATLVLVDKNKRLINEMGIIDNALVIFDDDQCPGPAAAGPSASASASASAPAFDASGGGGILVRGLGFTYPKGDRPVFAELDATFEGGKVTALLGENGAGKSTLISLLYKYLTPSEGEIYLDGVPYSRLTVDEVRRRIFVLPQNPQLLNRTVYENVIYGIRRPDGLPVSKGEVDALAASLGLSGFMDKVGWDSPVGIRGSSLSGGQRQVVWLLRLFLADPEVAILDEPTAALDRDTKELVLPILLRAMRGRTVIVITHDPFIVNQADVTLSI